MATDYVSLSDRRARVVLRPNDRIDGRGTLHQLMAEKWDLLEDLLEGSEAMRSRGDRWLPKHEKEQVRNWEARRDRSFLFGAFKETVSFLTAKPFAHPIVLVNPETLPGKLRGIEKNPDFSGRNLTDWAREIFKTAEIYGLTHVVPDMPVNLIKLTEGRRPLLSEEDAMGGLRPRLIHVKPRNLIGWDTITDPATGHQRLTRIRIHEERVEPFGEFGDQIVELITVWTESSLQRFRRARGDDDWTPTTEPIPHSYGAVPLLTFYMNRTGHMTADPPFQDLADANLEHWQKASDHSNIMHFHRFAILFAKGVPKEKWDTITIGPSNVIKTESTDADLSYVEHKGNATGANMDDINKLEERMERLGLNPIVKRSFSQTATAARLNATRTGSQMQAWVEGFERFLVLCYQAAAHWDGEEIPSEFDVEVFNDFDIELRGEHDLRELREARKLKEITPRLYLEEIQKRGMISETVNVETEAEEAREEREASQPPPLEASDPEQAVEGNVGEEGQETPQLETVNTA